MIIRMLPNVKDPRGPQRMLHTVRDFAELKTAFLVKTQAELRRTTAQAEQQSARLLI